MINACYAGESDPDPETFEVMNLLFSDLRRRSGAMVIAASAANQFAFTGRKKFGNNSAFGAVLLNLLQSEASLGVNELNEKLSAGTFQITGRKQQPIMRNRNLSLDFRIW